MRDDLIGYVLGALDASEEDQIRDKVKRDATLGQELEVVKRALRPLSWVRDDEVDPPGDLVSRTCSQLDSVPLMSESDRSVSLPVGADFTAQPCDGRPVAEREWVMADLVVAVGVCFAAACLFFPAIANSRWRSQIAGCQHNMRDVGMALIDYSGGPGGYFPQIPASGKLSVAGIYAPKLIERGFLQDGRVFLCPGKSNTMVVKIPRIQDIVAARGPQLVTLHRTMGGDYAYPLGFVEQGRLRGIRNQARSTAALLSDAPLENTPNFIVGSHGRGQNVLFQDGHVKYMLTRHSPANQQDDLFFNDQGFVQAGLHAQDFVLAPSPISPLPANFEPREGDPSP